MKLKLAIFGIAALCGVALAPAAASAMPNGLPAGHPTANIEQVRYVCNAWGRCWWRPNDYGAYGFYGGPRFYGPQPWHGGPHRQGGWQRRW
jgi:Spy/CpxP family protein refolding chaperone